MSPNFVYQMEQNLLIRIIYDTNLNDRQKKDSWNNKNLSLVNLRFGGEIGNLGSDLPREELDFDFIIAY